MAVRACRPRRRLDFTTFVPKFQSSMSVFSRQHPLRRMMVAFLACWFVVSISEPAVLHSCPMHDGTSVTASGNSHGEHQMSHMPAGAAGENASGTQQTLPEHTAPHSCTCMGDCSASATVAPTSVARMTWLAGIIDIATELWVAHPAAPVDADFVLPFANGPPMVALVS